MIKNFVEIHRVSGDSTNEICESVYRNRPANRTRKLELLGTRECILFSRSQLLNSEIATIQMSDLNRMLSLCSKNSNQFNGRSNAFVCGRHHVWIAGQAIHLLLGFLPNKKGRAWIRCSPQESFKACVMEMEDMGHSQYPA